MLLDEINDEQDLCDFLAGLQGDRDPSVARHLLFALRDKAKAIMDDTPDTFEDPVEALIAEGDRAEVPLGAIENGLELARRLEEHYDFQCDGGSLATCSEWLEFRKCFNALAESHLPQASVTVTPVEGVSDDTQEKA